jgi:hypothetical protein
VTWWGNRGARFQTAATRSNSRGARYTSLDLGSGHRLLALRVAFTRRRTDDAGAFFGIERISKRTILAGRPRVNAARPTAKPRPTAVIVKLLLPPRQSRGTSLGG